MTKRTHWPWAAAAVACSAFALLAWSATSGQAAPAAVAAPSQLPAVSLPQVRIDSMDLSGWPHVKLLATVLDGRGAPVELKHLLRLDILDGSKKASVASKQNPALVSFEKGVALDRRKDAKLGPRAEAGVGLDLVLVVQGYASTVEPLMQQRIRDAVAAAFKPLGKGDRVNLVWYGDRVYQATGLKNFDTRLVDVEKREVLDKCKEALLQAHSGGPITLGPAATKDNPAPEPGTDLCGLQGDAGKLAALAKNAPFEGAFPRLFNLGPPFYELTRYCGTPGGALSGFGNFTKEEYSHAKQEREDAALRGEPVDFDTSAIDQALQVLIRDGKPANRKAIVVLSDGRDGWVWDYTTCAEHPPAPCNAYDPAGSANTGRLAAMTDRQQLVERHRLQTEMRACMERDQLLTRRVGLMQKLFHDKAAQWIGLARAADIHFYAVGIHRTGLPTSPFDLDRLHLLAARTGGTYREVDDNMPAIAAVGRTMSEVTGQLAIEFTHQAPDDVPEKFSARLSVRLDPKVEATENPGTQLASEPLTLALPLHKSILHQLIDVGWSLLVKIQMLVGYEVYVILGWIVTIGAILLSLLVIVLLAKKLFGRKPAADKA